MLIMERAGLLSTVQDGGRPGVQALGVTPGGAVDDVALRVGNMIVGNPPDLAAIEMTLQGADIRFARDTLVALTGAPLIEAGTPLPMWRPLWMKAGACLRLGRMPQGTRSYLCVQGGILTPPVLGGRGVDFHNGFGGGTGRALRDGDTLEIATQEPRYATMYRQLQHPEHDRVAARWQVSIWRDWRATPVDALPLLPGPAQAHLSASSMRRLFAEDFVVSTASDRQGLRLQGKALPDALPRQASAGVCFGLMQLPPEGHPIVLLADHQTTGGYPVLGVVASVARTRLAQARPGDTLRFRPTTLGEAHALLWQREQRLHRLKQMLRWQMWR